MLSLLAKVFLRSRVRIRVHIHTNQFDDKVSHKVVDWIHNMEKTFRERKTRRDHFSGWSGMICVHIMLTLTYVKISTSIITPLYDCEPFGIKSCIRGYVLYSNMFSSQILPLSFLRGIAIVINNCIVENFPKRYFLGAKHDSTHDLKLKLWRVFIWTYHQTYLRLGNHNLFFPKKDNLH